jgi:hypothetical protein
LVVTIRSIASKFIDSMATLFNENPLTIAFEIPLKVVNA